VNLSKPGPSIDVEIAELIKRKKKWETKLKRATTAIKEIDKKMRHLEKKKTERSNEEK
jgi:hypothetical protein